MKPRTTKVGLCKELEGRVFHYARQNTADLMQTTQEKIHQNIGTKFSKDIANKLQNKKVVLIPPPMYSQAIIDCHAKWTKIKRDEQVKILAALVKKESDLKSKELSGEGCHCQASQNQIQDQGSQVRAGQAN